MTSLKQILKECEKSNHKDSLPIRSIKYGWDYCPYTAISPDKPICKYQGQKRLVVKRWFYECVAVKDVQ